MLKETPKFPPIKPTPADTARPIPTEEMKITTTLRIFNHPPFEGKCHIYYISPPIHSPSTPDPTARHHHTHTHTHFKMSHNYFYELLFLSVTGLVNTATYQKQPSVLITVLNQGCLQTHTHTYTEPQMRTHTNTHLYKKNNIRVSLQLHNMHNLSVSRSLL